MNEGWWHGSFAWLPETGTIQVEFADAVPPNQYWVPSVVVTTHHSPFCAPFPAPVMCRMYEPSSPRRCQRSGVPPSLMSSPAWPASDSVALSVAQHSSPVLTLLFEPESMSSAQDRYRRSMYPGPRPKPPPAQAGWLFEAAIRPATVADEYDSASDGTGPPTDAGVRSAQFPRKSPL